MAEHLFFNPGPTSVVFTPDGRSVDAQERVTANPNSPTVKALVERGALVDQGEPGADGEPQPPQTEQVIVDDDAEAPTESGD